VLSVQENTHVAGARQQLFDNEHAGAKAALASVAA
jgi:hypothetical protein